MSSFYRKTFKVSCSAISFDELDEVHHFLWMNELTDSPKNKWIQDNFVECNADGSPIVVVHCYQQGAAFANCGSVGRGQRFITEPITCPDCLSFKPEECLHDWTDWNDGESVIGSVGMEGHHCRLCNEWETRLEPPPDSDVGLVERLAKIWSHVIYRGTSRWEDTAPSSKRDHREAARAILAELRNMGWGEPEQFNRINELLLRDALINGLVKKPDRFSDEEFEALKKEIRLGVLAERLDLPPTFTNRRLLSGEFLFDNGKFVSTAEHDRKIARAALQAILDKLGLEIDVTIP